jgi:hypothetical protein
VAALDDSVSWDDHDNIKVAAPTEVYRPVEQRRAAIAAMEAALDKIRQVEAGETTWEPMQPGEQGAEDLPSGWRRPRATR